MISIFSFLYFFFFLFYFFTNITQNYTAYICMLRPDSQPPAGFEAGRPASKPASRLRSCLLVLKDKYTIENFICGIVRSHKAIDAYFGEFGSRPFPL